MARDLSPAERRSILNQIREQVGDIAYNQLLAMKGEDALIRMALGEPEPQAKPEPKPSWWLLAGLVAAGIIGALVTLKTGDQQDAAWKRAGRGFLLGSIAVPLFGLMIYAYLIDPLLKFGGWVNQSADSMAPHSPYVSESMNEQSRKEMRFALWVMIGGALAVIVGLVLLIWWLVG